MKVEWDDRKNEINLRKHGFDLADAVPVFEGPLLAQPDTQDYGESRWIGIGITNRRTVVVVFAVRENNCIRVISLRKANRHERKLFEEAFANELEEN